MGSYNVILKPAVEKDLRSFSKKMLARVFGRIETLENDPLPRQSVKLEGSEQMYRLRVGDYRIIYEIDHEERQITVHHVRHRREVYRGY
jgi:mRNA interferase RelE/StbE